MISANRVLARLAPSLRRIGRREIAHQATGRSTRCGIRWQEAASVQRHTFNGDVGAPFSSSAAHIEQDEYAGEGTVETKSDDGDELSSEAPSGKYDGVPSEKVIRTGTLSWINPDKGYGMLCQDEEFRGIAPAIPDGNVFFRFHNIHREGKAFMDAKMLRPILHMDCRYQFRVREGMVRTKTGKEKRSEAFDIRIEGGKSIVVMSWETIVESIMKSKARLGHQIYDILSKSDNPDKMGEDVNKAIERCNERVVWAKEQVIDPEIVSRSIKAKLGEEVYDLLSNIVSEDGIEWKVNAAFKRCKKDLSSLGLSLEPGGSAEEDEPKQPGFKEFMERPR